MPGTPLPSLVLSSPPSLSYTQTTRDSRNHVRAASNPLAIPHVCQRAPCLFARAHTFYATPRVAHNLLGRRRHRGTLCPNARVHPVFLVVTRPTPNARFHPLSLSPPPPHPLCTTTATARTTAWKRYQACAPRGGGRFRVRGCDNRHRSSAFSAAPFLHLRARCALLFPFQPGCSYRNVSR